MTELTTNKFNRIESTASPRRELLGVPVTGVILAAFAWWVSQEPGIPMVLSDLVYLLSGFVFVGGIVLYFRAPSRFKIGDKEEIVEAFHPRLILAYVLIIASLPMLAVSVYMYEYTAYPYIFVFIPLLVGLYLLISGILRYWRNTLTTYYITTERIVRANRFLSMDNNHLEIEKISSLNEGHSWYSGLLGIEQASFSSASGSIRLRDSPKSKNIVGMSRRIQKELSSRKMQQRAHFDAKALRDALGDLAETNNEKDTDDKPSGNHNDSLDGRINDSKVSEDNRPESADRNDFSESVQSDHSDNEETNNDTVSNPAKEKKSSPNGTSGDAKTDDIEEAVELLDRYVNGWSQEGCENEYLWAFVEDQVEVLNQMGVEVVLPEMGSEADPYLHETIATKPSSEPPKTILLVVQAGLRGHSAKQRYAQVITSSGTE